MDVSEYDQKMKEVFQALLNEEDPFNLHDTDDSSDDKRQKIPYTEWECMKEIEQRYGTFDDYVLSAWYRLGCFDYQMKDYKNAAWFLQTAYYRYKKKYGTGDVRTVRAGRELATVLHELERFREELALRKELFHALSEQGKNYTRIVSSMIGISKCELCLEHYLQAAEWIRKALELYEQHKDDYYFQIWKAQRKNLALCYKFAGKKQEELEVYRENISMLKKESEKYVMDVSMEVLYNLDKLSEGLVAYSQKTISGYIDPQEVYERTWEFFQTAQLLCGKTDETTRKAVIRLAKSLDGIGKLKEAITLLEDFRDELLHNPEHLSGLNFPYIEFCIELVYLYRKAGMTEQMKKLAEEVISQLLPVSGYNEIGKQILGLRAVLQEMDEKNR